MKDDAAKRSFKNFEARAVNDEMIVEGYAVKFDEETVLYESDGIEYKEVVERGAFEEVDLSDIIFNYNHAGKVIARTRNETLKLSVDQDGLYIRADVSGTKEGREIYEEIKGGYIDKMSFRFTVSEDAYDRDTHTRTIQRIGRLFDVSAVDIPAYDGTDITARSYFEAEAEKVSLEKLERKKKMLKLKLQLGGK